jgi:hypothetical protein
MIISQFAAFVNQSRDFSAWAAFVMGSSIQNYASNTGMRFKMRPLYKADLRTLGELTDTEDECAFDLRQCFE